MFRIVKKRFHIVKLERVPGIGTGIGSILAPKACTRTPHLAEFPCNVISESCFLCALGNKNAKKSPEVTVVTITPCFAKVPHEKTFMKAFVKRGIFVTHRHY